MNQSMTFETTFQLLAATHVVSLMLLISVSNICLAIIEAFEEVNNYK